VEATRRILATVKRSFKVTGMDFSGYMVKDGARAITWYRDVLGFEPFLVYPDNRGAEYELPDGTIFGLFGGGGKVMPFQPSNGILFAVDDLEAAVAELRSKGIEIVKEFQTPNCRMAGISDSEGNLVFLHRRNAV
jgi:predicted enzyme related to lactoylglutathione lyase